MDDLPELPEPDYPAGVYGLLGEHCFTADRMRAYGAACAAHAREACAMQLDRLGNDHCAAAIRAWVK